MTLAGALDVISWTAFWVMIASFIVWLFLDMIATRQHSDMVAYQARGAWITFVVAVVLGAVTMAGAETLRTVERWNSPVAAPLEPPPR